ncbi:glycosyl transferase [Bacillus sp. FJAT-42376]|uniref:glycosyltransferase family 32 protein n=1 Tax=Bacillus sp. FJAT-42376 TaxID=2014076 RepID=UPI000F50C34E|nr:glycosyltransferase [Bacillus sp. FJAT-42376]AZB43589.1 glycosyl transferase [Bacillus sp. FJAT-42376]
MEDEKIPKVIHYCWFGNSAKPKLFLKCLESWKKHLPCYEIKEWNESNFDINSSQFAAEAYKARKFAFVSDYARLDILYKEGGIYLDTDVEVLKPLDPLLVHEGFSGFEDETHLQSGTMGAKKLHPMIKIFLEYYNDKMFVNSEGVFDMTTNTKIMTNLSKEYGLVQNNEFQNLNGSFAIYPRTYFSPYDYINGGTYISDDSYTIHHYAQTWLPASVRLKSRAKKAASRIIGPNAISAIRHMVSGKPQ